MAADGWILFLPLNKDFHVITRKYTTSGPGHIVVAYNAPHAGGQVDYFAFDLNAEGAAKVHNNVEAAAKALKLLPDGFSIVKEDCQIIKESYTITLKYTIYTLEEAQSRANVHNEARRHAFAHAPKHTPSAAELHYMMAALHNYEPGIPEMIRQEVDMDALYNPAVPHFVYDATNSSMTCMEQLEAFLYKNAEELLFTNRVALSNYVYHHERNDPGSARQALVLPRADVLLAQIGDTPDALSRNINALLRLLIVGNYGEQDDASVYNAYSDGTNVNNYSFEWAETSEAIPFVYQYALSLEKLQNADAFGDVTLEFADHVSGYKHSMLYKGVPLWHKDRLPTEPHVRQFLERANIGSSDESSVLNNNWGISADRIANTLQLGNIAAVRRLIEYLLAAVLDGQIDFFDGATLTFLYHEDNEHGYLMISPFVDHALLDD